MTTCDRSDPGKVSGLAELLRKLIPGATVASRDMGNWSAVEFTISTEAGSGWLLVTYECFERNDVDRIEKWIKERQNELAAGVKWQLESDGTFRRLP